MCGIVGGVSFGSDFIMNHESLIRASEFLKYRGPDDFGEIMFESQNAKVCLAHRRLSIIDLSKSGHQPMESASKNTVIVYNGEIYNYMSIRNELEAKSFKFHSNSDTEVILNSFECWGIKQTLQKLDGMFAFALFDKTSDTLYLARDIFGKKPLFFLHTNDSLMFSSDIRSFESVRGINLTIDLHSLGYYFAELSTPETGTIWTEVKKLKPGHFLKFSNNGLNNYNAYWNLNYSANCNLNEDEITEHVEELLSLSVKKRLTADVNVAALLSGGIDSSLMVAKMAQQSSSRVKTYSVGFEEDVFNELPYAKLVSEKYDTDHTELILTPSNASEINSIIYEFGEPFADSSMIPTYLISKEISKVEKVVLGGDGGDELFAGYDSYFFAHKYDKVQRLKPIRGILKSLRHIYPSYRTDFLYRLMRQSERDAYSLLNRELAFTDDELRLLYNEKIFWQSLNKEHEHIWAKFSTKYNKNLTNLMSTSLHTRLVNDYLVKVDRASMYASLEMRSPFLDKDLAEFSSTLRSEQLISSMGPKTILKRVAEKYFSKSFIHRKKMGFRIPIEEWFRKELKHMLREVVIGGKQNLIPLNYDFIEKLINEHETGKANHGHKIWSLYVFHLWAQAR